MLKLHFKSNLLERDKKNSLQLSRKNIFVTLSVEQWPIPELRCSREAGF